MMRLDGFSKSILRSSILLKFSFFACQLVLSDDCTFLMRVEGKKLGIYCCKQNGQILHDCPLKTKKECGGLLDIKHYGWQMHCVIPSPSSISTVSSMLNFAHESETKIQQLVPDQNKCTSEGFSLKKINERLYTAKRNGLTFVMERVDSNSSSPTKRLEFWKDFVRNEFLAKDEYIRTVLQMPRDWKLKNPERKEPLFFETIWRNQQTSLYQGLLAMNRTLRDFHQNNELWISFVHQDEVLKEDDITADKIEMQVTVLTDPDAPMTMHMGINRSFQYLLKNLKSEYQVKDFSDGRLNSLNHQLSGENFPVHEHLAMPLHGFSAKVMIERDKKKRYMITTPVKAMRDMMVKNLAPDIRLGTTWDRAMDIYFDDVLGSNYFYKTSVSLKERINKLQAQSTEYLKSHQNKEFDQAQTEIESLKRQIEFLELQEINSQLEVTHETSPVKIVWRDQSGRDRLQIFDVDQTTVLFDSDRDKKAIQVNGLELKGDQVKRFDWFYHPDQVGILTTIDLSALAKKFD